ncbi:MAG TPA: 2-amino-4-hydroxy-6-hydroxymethyldihydropteridine diphosphokinase [Nitrospiria bacterium]|nr:2-amino-4-hydroxy-6-hydroxymethyldihydropteridine diphosphokinase [Nitrospiria bacterium]
MIVFIGLGSNLGDREAYIDFGVREIGKIAGETSILELSSLYETEPVSETHQPLFLNAVLKAETGLSPEKFLEALLRIEKESGRLGTGQEEPRTLDLDLLFYGDRILQKEKMIVPHPRLHLRKFVLAPLSEIAPDWEHPVFKKSIKDLLKDESSGYQVVCYRRRENQKAAAQ